MLLCRSVAEKLARIDARLCAAGLELLLLDAWRPKAVQACFHDIWMPKMRGETAAHYGLANRE
ncbi:MAG: hypothetical protein WDN03_04095 [Rhizomicrobium sp.]